MNGSYIELSPLTKSYQLHFEKVYMFAYWSYRSTNIKIKTQAFNPNLIFLLHAEVPLQTTNRIQDEAIKNKLVQM